MLKDKKKEAIVYAVICLVLFVLIICLIYGFYNSRKSVVTATESATVTSGTHKLFDMESVPDEIVTVNTQIVEDGLREMGVLITEEYYFTQVEEYSSSKKLWILDSKAYLAYSYDGVVSAGIDCGEVEIDKDDDNKRITVRIPGAEIIGVNIDFDSFRTLQEKDGLWNKLDMSDYNTSLVRFEEAARDKALEKDIIGKADEGAEKMIRSFVDSLIDNDEYTVEFVKK